MTTEQAEALQDVLGAIDRMVTVKPPELERCQSLMDRLKRGKRLYKAGRHDFLKLMSMLELMIGESTINSSGYFITAREALDMPPWSGMDFNRRGYRAAR